MYLSWILLCFEALSTCCVVRVNLDKSVIFLVGEMENVDQLAHELGCKVGALPSMYLGLSLGARHYAVSVWEGIEERFRKRLASWKRLYISKGVDLHSSEATFQICLFTSSPFSSCPRV